MLKLNKVPNDDKLIDLGFERVATIIHPSRITKNEAFSLGQIDENEEAHSLWKLKLQKGFRFNKYIVINYRGEVYGVESGFVSGGIETYDFYDERQYDSFCFNEDVEWENDLNGVLSIIIEE